MIRSRVRKSIGRTKNGSYYELHGLLLYVPIEHMGAQPAEGKPDARPKGRMAEVEPMQEGDVVTAGD
jgi:hypothetical protein